MGIQNKAALFSLPRFRGRAGVGAIQFELRKGLRHPPPSPAGRTLHPKVGGGAHRAQCHQQGAR